VCRHFTLCCSLRSIRTHSPPLLCSKVRTNFEMPQQLLGAYFGEGLGLRRTWTRPHGDTSEVPLSIHLHVALTQSPTAIYPVSPTLSFSRAGKCWTNLISAMQHPDPATRSMHVPSRPCQHQSPTRLQVQPRDVRRQDRSTEATTEKKGHGRKERTKGRTNERTNDNNAVDSQ